MGMNNSNVPLKRNIMEENSSRRRMEMERAENCFTTSLHPAIRGLEKTA